MTDISEVSTGEELKAAVSGDDKRSYTVFKAELDTEMHRASDSFVRIGFLLKEARDTGILEGSGYATMSDFAKTEYGLTPDQTSRFINVYERFGDGEGHLKTEYQEHGQTKLIEMLSLPDAVAESIPAELPREEIRHIRQEVKEEQQVTPIERAIESSDIPKNLNDLEEFIYVHLQNADVFRKYWEAMKKIPVYDEGALLCMFDKSGIVVISEKLPRKGRILLSFNGTDHKPALVNVRQDTRTEIEWADLHTALSYRLYPEEYMAETPEEDYERTYGPMEEPAKLVIDSLPEEKHEEAEPEEEKAPQQVKEEPESQSPTNIEPISEPAQQVKNEEPEEEENSETVRNCPNVSEASENEKIAPAQFMNLPEEEGETYYIRAKRAVSALDEALQMFQMDIAPNLIALEIQEQMDRVEEKVAEWRNIMIEWRKSKE